MTISEFAVSKKNYCHLAKKAGYPNHDSERLLAEFDPHAEINLDTLTGHVRAAVQGGTPSWYSGWPKTEELAPILWHRPMIRNSTVGEKVEPFFDNLYLLAGDVLTSGDIPLAFTWPAKAFSKTEEVKVPKLETWLAEDLVESDSAKQFVGEVGAADPESTFDLLVTRKRMPIPKEFVDIVWEERPARETLRMFNDRIKQLAREGEAEGEKEIGKKFRHFIDHWRVANTEQGRKELAKNVGEPIALTANQGRMWVASLVAADLKQLDSPEGSTEPPDHETAKLLSATLAAVQENTKATKFTAETLSEAIVAGLEGQAASKVPSKTVEKKWPTRLPDLKRMVGVTTSSQLPLFWHHLAKCQGHEKIGLFQQHLNEEAAQLNLGLRFIVTARTIKSLEELKFCSHGNLEKGVNLFNSICFQHHSKASSIQDFNADDYWINGEKTAASLNDRKAHDKTKHVWFPQDAMQFRELVLGNLVLKRVVLGRQHPLTVRYQTFTESVDDFARQMAASKQEKALARALLGIHSRIDQYYKALEGVGANPEKNLPALDMFFDNCYHGGSLPELSNFVDVKSPETIDHPKREYKEAQGLGKEEKNPHLMQAHKFDGPTTSALIKKNGDPPKHENGKSICLIWHTKGACKEKCSRKHSHVQLSEKEASELKDYLDK